MDLPTSENFDEIKSPQDRLTQKLIIKSEYDIASQLLARGEYREALKKFKSAFSHDPSSEFFLSSTQIRKILRNYPSAIPIIKRWRNDKESLVKAQAFDLYLVQQWSRLNSCLGEPDRTKTVYFQLKSTFTDRELLECILYELWTSFVRSRNYSELQPLLPRLGFFLLLNAIEYESIELFPRQNGLTPGIRRKHLQRRTRYMLREGIMIYEVALGVGEKRIASELAEKILSIEKSDQSYSRLIKAAIRTKSYEQAVTLFQQARQSHSLRKLPQSAKLVKTIPASKLTSLKPAK